VFACPASVVDNGLKLASENQLKVILYILRHGGEKITDEDISEYLGIHSQDVRDAIEYWIDKGLFVSVGEELRVSEKPEIHKLFSDNLLIDTDGSQVVAKNEDKPRPVSRPQKPEYSYVRERIEGDKNLSLLMDEASTMLGKLLSRPDMATLLMLHDTDGLPVEVLLMLLQHCVNIGRPNMRYIEKTGISWGNEGIVTLALAEEKIKSYSESTSAWNTVAAVFGIKISGTPTQKQLEYAGRWINEWRFSEEMLRLAYERCVDKHSEVKLPYINGILKRWNEQSLRKAEDVYKADAELSNKKNKATEDSVNTASYDIDAYESKSIFDD